MKSNLKLNHFECATPFKMDLLKCASYFRAVRGPNLEIAILLLRNRARLATRGRSLWIYMEKDCSNKNASALVKYRTESCLASRKTSDHSSNPGSKGSLTTHLDVTQAPRNQLSAASADSTSCVLVQGQLPPSRA